MNKKIKVLILHNYMAPYRFPLFKGVAEDPGVDLTVYFMSQSAKNRRWGVSQRKLGFRYEILPKIEFNYYGRDFFAYIINYTFPIKFLKGNFDIVISAGWLDFASQVGFLLCKLTNKKFIIWSESTINERSWRRIISLPLVKLIVRYSDACIAIGTRAKEYLLELGGKPEKIFVGYSTVDIKHFDTASGLTNRQKSILKRKLGIKTKKVILYIGQFIERKGVIYLIKAFRKIAKVNKEVSLILLGYGPEKKEYEDYIREKNVKNVFLINHVEVSEMPKMYSVADLFILPSLEETWGLVINEAMASGLPVVTTTCVGASVDLIHVGRNGFVVRERNPDELYESIKIIISDKNLINKMGRESRKIIKNFGPEHQARSFLNAIEFVGTKN